MKVIILAGGRATRLPQSAKDIPKVLVRVGAKTILQHQIDGLTKHGFFDIRLALGYRADMIIEWLTGYRPQTTGSSLLTTAHRLPQEKEAVDGRRSAVDSPVDSSRLAVDWVIESEPLDTGGAIKLAAKGLKEPFMVLNGDILSDINFTNFYRKFQKRPEENIMAVFHTKDASSYGIIKKEKGRVAQFLEKPAFAKASAGKPASGYINAGFYILSPKVFKDVGGRKFSIEREVFPKISDGGNLSYYIHKGIWTDAGTEERLAEVRRFFSH